MTDRRRINEYTQEQAVWQQMLMSRLDEKFNPELPQDMHVVVGEGGQVQGV